MSKLTFAVCALFTVILFAFALCFALLFAKLDRIENAATMAQSFAQNAQNDATTLASEVKALQSTILAADENLEPVEYFVYEDGSIQIVRDNGETITYCLENADCDN